MKILISFLFVTVAIYANSFKNIESFEANFTQTIINASNNEITYDGKIYVKKPDLVFWKYTTPIEKLVYIKDGHVTMIEPELEQAIKSKLNDELNILDIIKNSTKIEKNLYEADVLNTTYTIYEKDNKVNKITYKDQIENKVSIEFSNTKQNHTIPNNTFMYIIPYEYDIIRK